jgi:protein-S-isoprenylcysteine O-methyltransferase Ste14
MLVLVPVLWSVATMFVMLYEEPTLRRLFGKDYEAYARNVHRWLPRFRPYVSGEASGSNIL